MGYGLCGPRDYRRAELILIGGEGFSARFAFGAERQSPAAYS